MLYNGFCEFEKTGIGFLIVSLCVDRTMKTGFLERLRDLIRREIGHGIQKVGEEEAS